MSFSLDDLMEAMAGDIARGQRHLTSSNGTTVDDGLSIRGRRWKPRSSNRRSSKSTYYIQHREEILEYQRNYRRNNHEKDLARKRLYHRTHKEQEAARAKLYRESGKRWGANHKASKRAKALREFIRTRLCSNCRIGLLEQLQKLRAEEA